jgi:BASS family bile acid:Na+ symporter
MSLLLRRLLPPARLTAAGPAVDGAVVWLVVFYGFAVMDGMLRRLLADPGWILGATALAFATNLALNAATAAAFAPCGRRIALSAGLLSGNRNMALFLAVLPATTEPQILLFFALAQFPLFLSPALLRPLYRRLGTGA